MARRRRTLFPPTTQLARAGERTRILIADKPVPEVRFRASTLVGEAAGRLEIETKTGPRVLPLSAEHRLDGTDLKELAVVPEADTAITFIGPQRTGGVGAFLIGSVLVLGAIAWTAYGSLVG